MILVGTMPDYRTTIKISTLQIKIENSCYKHESSDVQNNYQVSIIYDVLVQTYIEIKSKQIDIIVNDLGNTLAYC